MSRRWIDTPGAHRGDRDPRLGERRPLVPPLQRCFRDLHVANQHIYFSPAALERYAKTRLEIAQPTFMR